MISQLRVQRFVGFCRNFRRLLTVSVSDRLVVVEEAGKRMKFPAVWLRDNCQCSECFHESSQSRAVDWEKFDLDVKVKSLATDEGSKSVLIEWTDSHKSIYPVKWLEEREFKRDSQQKYLDNFYRPKCHHWGKADFSRIFQEFHYQDILQSDTCLRDWLKALAVYGIALIRGAPVEETANRKLMNRVGFIRRTHYGEEFIVQAKPNAKNFAYQSSFLPLHTDLPYYEYKPGVNVLHCLVQSKSEGGSNLLADGFFAADRLKIEHPTMFDALKNTQVDWNDIGQEDGIRFHTIYRSPVINVDQDGYYKRINRSVPQRDSHFNIDLDKVVPWYQAYAQFMNIVRQETVSIKIQPGDILTFNNIRVLHGRTAYTDRKDNARYIVGAYLDWDILLARLRTLL